MIRYDIEKDGNNTNLYLIDEEYDLKILVAVIFDSAHARIILRKMNEYVKEDDQEG